MSLIVHAAFQISIFGSSLCRQLPSLSAVINSPVGHSVVLRHTILLYHSQQSAAFSGKVLGWINTRSWDLPSVLCYPAEEYYQTTSSWRIALFYLSKLGHDRFPPLGTEARDPFPSVSDGQNSGCRLRCAIRLLELIPSWTSVIFLLLPSPRFNGLTNVLTYSESSFRSIVMDDPTNTDYIVMFDARWATGIEYVKAIFAELSLKYLFDFLVTIDTQQIQRCLFMWTCPRIHHSPVT